MAISAICREDLEEIVAIEATISSPWSAAMLLRELELPQSWHFVARLPGSAAVAGYLLGWAIADEAEIHKIAVAPACRRQGVATALLGHGLNHLRGQGIKHCFLELRASNQAALNLYAQQGFQVSGRRKKYYSDPEEDAVTMQTTI